MLAHIVCFAQIFHALWLANALIFARHMVGNEVDNHLQAFLMGAFYQVFKLAHTFRNIISDVGVDVVIVGNGIGRTCLTLNNTRCLTWNTESRIVGASGMTNDTSIPNGIYTERLYLLQCCNIKVVHLSNTIFCKRTVWLSVAVLVAKGACKHLVNY